MKLLLDEMYPGKLAQALRDQGIDAVTVAELGMAGRQTLMFSAAAADGGYALLTENVSDFARLCGEHVAAGRHHSRRADRTLVAVLAPACRLRRDRDRSSGSSW